MNPARPPRRAAVSRLLAAATLGLGTAVGAAALPALCEEPRSEASECLTWEQEPRHAAPAEAPDRLSYLFWV